jgi:hypothetical protein
MVNDKWLMINDMNSNFLTAKYAKKKLQKVEG